MSLTYRIASLDGDSQPVPEALAHLPGEALARAVAELFHYQRGGWEMEWPLTFIFERDSVEIGCYEVQRELLAVFTAKAKT